MILHSLLVGAHFRPPAKQVLAHLPAGTELVLQREPENPYDSGAIKVLVDLKYELPEGQRGSLDVALLGTGTDLVELLAAEEPLQLGFIIAPTNKKLGHWASNVAVGELMASGLYVARLMFTPEGEPTVVTSSVEDPE